MNNDSKRNLLSIFVLVVFCLLAVGSIDTESEPTKKIDGGESSKQSNSNSAQTKETKENKKEAETIDGTYTYSDNSGEFEITISGDRWYSKLTIVTGFGSDYDSQRAEHNSGIVNGNDLYYAEGMAAMKIGYVSGRSLIYQRLTLRKNRN